MTIDYVAWIVVIALTVGVFGVQTCSDTQAMSKAREGALSVGEVVIHRDFIRVPSVFGHIRYSLLLIGDVLLR